MSRALLVATLILPLMALAQAGAANEEPPALEILSVEPVSRDVLRNDAYDVRVTVRNPGEATAQGEIYVHGRPVWWGIAELYPSADVSVPPGAEVIALIRWSVPFERFVAGGEVGPTEFGASARCEAPCRGDDEYANGLYPVWMPGPPIPA